MRSPRALSHLLLTAALVLAPMPAARAAEGQPKADGIVDVELPAMFAPMVVDQRLQSYAYITVALTPTGSDKVLAIREKVPFLRDAFLRELNKGTIVKADDPKSVDSAAVKTRLMARVKAVLPEGTVADLKLEQIVMAPLDGSP